MNIDGERFEQEFSFDEVLHQFRVETTDNYGYTEKYTYEPLFGSLESYTDKNSQVTSFGVDPKGRPALLLNSMDAKEGHAYSKLYTYDVAGAVAFATCETRLPDHDQHTKTIAFYDGLQRRIQSKKEAITSDGQTEKLVAIVSGQNSVDSLGRVVAEYLEYEEPINNFTIYNPQTSTIKPSLYEYDLNDRVMNIMASDEGETKMEYGIKSLQNELYLTANQTNPNGLQIEYYYSLRGELRAEKMTLPGEESWTHYVYNELSEIKEITHPSGSKTFYSYDLLGRRISVDVPDAGLTELVYDPAGNLIKKITATIREGLQEQAAIRYTYDKERLLTIDYPKNFQNKVELHYGESGAPFNRAGRIWLQEDGTGGREYFYDVFGNVTKEIRTVIINRSEIFTYVTEFKHDALNRIQQIIYPDGEVVFYAYDETGRLDRIYGEKAHDTYTYIDNIHYDFFLERIKTEYGNGVIEEEQYDDKGRVSEHDLSSESMVLLDQQYEYDLEDQLLEMVNNQSDDFIGQYKIQYRYDEKGRIIETEGNWNTPSTTRAFLSTFNYNPSNTLATKDQSLFSNGVQDVLRSSSFEYIYEDPAYPSRPSNVGGRSYAYDFNGNLNLINSNIVFEFSQFVYDEENRLMGASKNGKTSLYTYDAFGRRTIKSQGTIQGIFMNGAPAGLVEHVQNYRVDISPYFTVFKNDYRKHIYIDHTRVVTKIGTGIFQSNLADVPEITAGGIDYKARIQAYEQQILAYYASLGVPPGPPTLLAILGQPEINQVGFQDIDSSNPYENAPSNWPVLNEPDTLGPPGSPVFYNQSGITNNTVEAGYNFTSGEITKELEQFYFHYDVFQNVTLISSANGQARQYKLYLPSGETWISNHTTLDSSNYALAGLLYDNETEMYYMGEIYYDPSTNVELSVDKKEQTFGIETIDARIEGSLYYDFADFQDNIDFDPQIINSEKPSPFISGSARVVDFVRDKGDGFTIDFTTRFDAFSDEQNNPFTGNSSYDVKRKRRNVSLSPGNQHSHTFNEVFEAFEVANLQRPEGVNPNDANEFKAVLNQSKKMKAKKLKLKRRKKQNKLKVRFRVQ